MFACRGGTLASRARWGVLTWGGGGGEGDGEFAAVGNEGVQSRLQTFEGLAYVSLVSLGCVLQLGLLIDNLLANSDDVPVHNFELGFHLASLEAEERMRMRVR